MQNKEVLLSISNLKQYFPLKRGRVVKANDGVSIDIYKGETFGLVGESGCGKSTLGRTILQLYHQTYGRTMYYGRTLDDLAPKYVYKTIKHLPKLRAQWHELDAKRDPAEELGDLLFSCVNVARLCKLDPETLLTAATDKFVRRFTGMENLIISDGKALEDLTLSEMDVYWNRVKSCQEH